MGYKYVIELLLEYKIFNLVFFNTLAIFFPSFFISYFYKKSFFYTCIFLFILGILFHRLFCVRTTIDKILFP